MPRFILVMSLVALVAFSTAKAQTRARHRDLRDSDGKIDCRHPLLRNSFPETP
jgi:hypothetical protein